MWHALVVLLIAPLALVAVALGALYTWGRSRKYIR
jgi:hypothetical protein